MAYFKIETDRLRAAVSAVLPFASKDGIRPLQSVLFERGAAGLSVVASDGHTMAVAEPATVTGVDGTGSFLMTTADATLLTRALKTIKIAEVDVSFDAASLRIVDGANTCFTASALDFDFPPWRQVVPADSREHTRPEGSLNPEYLERACKAVRVFSGGAGRVRRLLDKGARMRFVSGSKLSATRIDWGHASIGSLILVIMPLR